MPVPLEWKAGEGYDIHVVRGAGKSKSLLNSLHLEPAPPANPAQFAVSLNGTLNSFGLVLDSATGEVTAQAHPPAPQAKFPNFNFLMTVQQIVPGVITRETTIRVHVHDSIQTIWLTPSLLTPRIDSDETRFTVLALFDDNTVGDITDWPQTQLKLVSSAPASLGILPGGFLKAKVAAKNPDVTATLKLTSPPTNKTATAKVVTQPKWEELGAAAKVEFVAGPVRPNPDDLDSPKPDSVKSVIDSATNILFISDGFLGSQEQDFRQQIIDGIVNGELRVKENLQPFKLLANSINYWAVFLESPEEAVSVLGDQQVIPGGARAAPIPLPRAPTQGASQWTLANLVQEGGLPLPSDSAQPDPATWVTNRSVLFNIPTTAPSNPAIDQVEVDSWNDLRFRVLLNERTSAFGLAHFDRPRASGQDASPNRLLLDPRRMSEASLQSFLENLKFGKDPNTSQTWSIGRNWVKPIWDGKDAGLVCFVCRSGTRGGMLKPPAPPMSYFTASTGLQDHVEVKASANGQEIVPPVGVGFSAPLLASLVAYGFGRALGLGDEEGDGGSGAPGPTTLVAGENLQPEILIVNSTGGLRTINVKKIAWVWPRITQAGLVEIKVDPNGVVLSPANCDQNGTANPTGAFLRIVLTKLPAKPFVLATVVRLRAVMVRFGGDLFWHAPSSDDVAGNPFLVDSVSGTTLILSRQVPNIPQLGYIDPTPGTPFDPASLKDVEVCALIAERFDAGLERKLIAQPILDQIEISGSPLNAPLGSVGQACTPAPSATADVTAVNLPAGLKLPRRLPSKADIVGIYDGGGHFGCEIFRPAGRCRMRRGPLATTPFCQVCSYVIVDRVDPTRHGDLDARYQPQYP